MEPYFILLFIAAAFLLLCVVSWMGAAFGGWRSLAIAYRAKEPGEGVVHYMQSAYIGSIVYKSCLTIRLSPAGIHLSVLPMFRIAHPPILIPWSELHNLRERKEWLLTLFEAEVGIPAIATVALPYRILEEAERLGYLGTPIANRRK